MTRGEELTHGEHPVDILLDDALHFKRLYEEMLRYQDYHCTGLHAGEFEEADECRWTGNQHTNRETLEEYRAEFLAPCRQAFFQELLSHQHLGSLRQTNCAGTKDFPKLFPIEELVSGKESPTWEYNPSFFASSYSIDRDKTAFDVKNNDGKRPIDLLLGI